MFHPWRKMRDEWPEWHIFVIPLPAGLLAGTDSSRRAVYVNSRAPQRQRRSSLAHELTHIEAGDEGCQHPKRERAVNAMAARRLISVEALMDVLRWANSPQEAAEELWVDDDTFNTRMQCLTPPELAEIRRIFNERESREGA